MNTDEFKHIKLHSDSTLKSMTKEELILYIHMLHYNWGACDESYNKVTQCAKLLDLALDKACGKLQYDTADEGNCPNVQYGFEPSCCCEENCEGSNEECWKEWCFHEITEGEEENEN